MKPMITIDERSKEPIYRQIIMQIRRLVATNALKEGDELPSLRQLAIDLHININTVALAYRELERQGIILMRQGSRAMVLAVDRASVEDYRQYLARMSEQFEHIRTEAILLGISMSDMRQLAMNAFNDATENEEKKL